MKLTDYSEKSFCIYGDTKEYADKLKALGGKWNSNLRDGPGWIFAIKCKDEVQNLIDEKVVSCVTHIVDTPVKFSSDIFMTEYSDKSIAVYGNTKIYKDKLKILGGKWNANLRDGPGWIFSNKHREDIERWLIDL